MPLRASAMSSAIATLASAITHDGGDAADVGDLHEPERAKLRVPEKLPRHAGEECRAQPFWPPTPRPRAARAAWRYGRGAERVAGEHEVERNAAVQQPHGDDERRRRGGEREVLEGGVKGPAGDADAHHQREREAAEERAARREAGHGIISSPGMSHAAQDAE